MYNSSTLGDERVQNIIVTVYVTTVYMPYTIHDQRISKWDDLRWIPISIQIEQFIIPQLSINMSYTIIGINCGIAHNW